MANNRHPILTRDEQAGLTIAELLAR